MKLFDKFTQNQAIRRARKGIRTVPDPTLNRVCDGLRAELDCEGAFVTFITTQKAFAIGAVGMPDFDPGGMPPTNSFCYHLLNSMGDGLAADNTRDVPMLELCPSVAFYGAWVGAPVSFEGVRIGAIGVVDAEPRHWPPNALAVVQGAATLTEHELVTLVRP